MTASTYKTSVYDGEHKMANQPFTGDRNEIGACSECRGYRCCGPHQRLPDGTVKIACGPARSMMVARVDIEDPQDCEYFGHIPLFK